MTGAEAIAKCLINEKVEYVFGYPGVAIAPLFDSLYGTQIHSVLIRQEQNAAHAASGYARISGCPGVVAVTSGPGAENLITGIATAFADSIPLVCITGQVDSTLMGSDVFQEADISGACESFVKYSYIVRDVQDIPRIMKEAFTIATTGRKGPVLIDVPVDVQHEKLSHFFYPEEVKMRTYKPTVEGHAVQIKKVISELSRAKRPILCAGGGTFLSGAASLVRIFAEKYHIPVVCTMMGLGVLPTDHPLFFGMVGNNGDACGNRAMNEADMIIMIGARVADRSISQPDLILKGKILVHIDVDPAEIGKNAGPTIPLVGDVSHVLQAFLKEDIRVSCDDFISQLCAYRKQWKEQKEEARGKNSPDGCVNPAAFIHALSEAMDGNAVYVADVGQNQLWSCTNCIIREGRFLTSGGMGTMGYALPAAMGAQLADPDRQVVAVCGDGGFQMSMMELSTMRQYHIPAKVVVLRNNTLGLVRQYQHLHLHDRFAVTDLGEYPKLEYLTGAYDMEYIRLTDNADIQDAVRRFLGSENSVLLEAHVSKDALA